MIRPDIHVGAVVIIDAPGHPEHGRVGKVTSRNAGPVDLWGVNDQKPRWLDRELRLPDEERPTPRTDTICGACSTSRRDHSDKHCNGEGGVITRRGPVQCGCRCPHREEAS